MKSIICIIFVSLSTQLFAELTNRVFLTEQTGTTVQPADAEHKQVVQEANEAPDARQAEQDVEGNWGVIVNDCQISARPVKAVFEAGEPIILRVIVHNLGDVPISYPWSNYDSLLQVSVLDDKRKPVPPRSIERQIVSSGGNMAVRPGWQRKFDVDLSKRFDLSEPGTYSVSVARPVDGKDSRVLVQSGTAIVRVIENSAKDADANALRSIVPTNLASPNVENSGASPFRNNSAGSSTIDSISSDQNGSRVLPNESSLAGTHGSASAQKIGIAAVAGLLALLLTILWRASRRKSRA